MGGVDESSVNGAVTWLVFLSFQERGKVKCEDRWTYFCLKYRRELNTAAMPCRHGKYMYEEGDMCGNEF